MSQVFSGNGIRFRYPDGWTITEQSNPSQAAITVQPGEGSTAFWSITLLVDRPEVDETLESVIDVFDGEYEDVDQYAVETEVARHPAIGRDIEFVCMELTNSAYVRVFRTGIFTAVVLYQATDHELDDVEDDLQSITASLNCDLDQGNLFG